MKLLIDQNISHRIVQQIGEVFTSIYHIRDFNLINADDHEIFMFARQNAFDAVITIDDDFVKLPKSVFFSTKSYLDKNRKQFNLSSF